MNKILFISNYKPGTGGISGQVEILQKKLCAEGFYTSIFQAKGSACYRIGAFFRLWKVGRNYDVFHIHCCSGWGFYPAVLGVWVGRRLKKRLVLTYHGGGAESFFAKHHCLVQYFLNKTDVNIALSGFLGKVFDEYKIPYIIIPNVIELDSSHYRERKILKPNFICTRSLDPLYNHACILKAFKRVQSQLPESTMVFVGGGTIRAEIEELSAKLGLRQVSFVGRVDNGEVYRYLDQADVMVSAPHIDNMPVSILEAINAGLLVISSCVGGVPYMLEDHKSALLFDDDDDLTLSDQMLEAVDNQVASVMLIRNARSNLNNYTWEQVRPMLLKQYSENTLCR